MKFRTFCASNSGDGFISLFDTLLDETKQRVYYIKGGPGCGKSTLLKQIASKADHVEIIHCSGDPNSVDGIVLAKQKAIVIDATAPHSYEPTYPGVGGNIVNLGTAWDPQKLNKEHIIQLSNEKKELYRQCYSILKGAKLLHSGIFKPLRNYIDIEKINSDGDKILRQNALFEKRKSKLNIQKRFLSAITADGRITFNKTFSVTGNNIILIEDRWMIGDLFLRHISKKLSDNGIDHIICYHPLLGTSAIQHLLIPSVGLSIITKDSIFPIDLPDEQITRKITLQKEIDKNYVNDNINKLTFFKRLLREILDMATEKLNEARSLHLQIEQEYSHGIDYAVIDDIGKKLINNLFSQT